MSVLLFLLSLQKSARKNNKINNTLSWSPATCFSWILTIWKRICFVWKFSLSLPAPTPPPLLLRCCVVRCSFGYLLWSPLSNRLSLIWLINCNFEGRVVADGRRWVGSILWNFSAVNLTWKVDLMFFLKNGPTSASFIAYFRSFQTNIITILQQIYVHPVYGAGIRTNNLLEHESPPITSRPKHPPSVTWCWNQKWPTLIKK